VPFSFCPLEIDLARNPILDKATAKMTSISSLAIRVHDMDAMLAFYSQAFQVQFREVDTYGIRSQFGEVDGITLKFVPIRESPDFKGYPVHQLGLTVRDVEAVIALAIQYGGRQEGQTLRVDGKTQAAIRDPDGNTLELYSD
jgi:predicted enzyme related to lactoylglutathione lyase